MDGQSCLTVNLSMWPPRAVNFFPCKISHVGPTYKKQFPLRMGQWLCWGEGVGLFGSDEERGGNCIFILCGLHMTYLTWKKIYPTWRPHGQINGQT